jgi:hypothetical protein
MVDFLSRLHSSHSPTDIVHFIVFLYHVFRLVSDNLVKKSMMIVCLIEKIRNVNISIHYNPGSKSMIVILSVVSLRNKLINFWLLSSKFIYTLPFSPLHTFLLISCHQIWSIYFFRIIYYCFIWPKNFYSILWIKINR